MARRRIFFSSQHMTGTVVFIFGICILLSSSFNIEHRLPIMKVGDSGSYFGLSIAQHHITANSKNPDDAVLLVGAPTDERAEQHPLDAVQPGGLYKCSVSENEKCERVIVTPIEDSNDDDLANQLFPDRVNSQRANCSYQWLGVNVKSHRPGGKIVVCGHRYTIRGGNRNSVTYLALVGRCFLLENTVKPPSDKLSYEYIPCQGMSDDRGTYDHLGFGYCQAGTAVDFADGPTNKKNDEFVVFGAPGSISWSGAFYASQLNPDLFPVHLWTREAPSDNADNDPVKKNSLLGSFKLTGTTWDILNPTTSLWYPKNEDKESQIPKNSRLGSSLASGVLLNDAMNYVSGAPGTNLTGSVVIFEKIIEENDDKFDIVEIINGDRIASRFGHEVLLVDVTGDGRLDLIVGAPQYYDREKKLGGAVYIYVNKDLGRIGPEPTQKLFGNLDSAFGMSITKIGDINMDGADDIAIGAPGEDNERGAVYIYHGNNAYGSIGVHDEPSQVIRASELISMGYLTKNITGMGYSLSGGLDMDFNGYPDIAAGSLSDSVVMFQSRPIVNIVGTIEGPKKEIVITDGVISDESYQVKVCLKYTAMPATFDEEIIATCTVKLDTTRLNTELRPRASFTTTPQSEPVKSFNITLLPQSRDKNKCKGIEVYINKDIQDKLSPIIVELSYTTPNTLPVRSKRAIRVPSPSPIMNTAIDNTASVEIKFSKSCGDDEVCKSQLALSAYYEILMGKKWKPLLEKKDDATLLTLGAEKQIGMIIEVKNSGEDAHQAHIFIDLPEELSYRRYEDLSSLGSGLHCEEENRTRINCNIGNPFHSNSSIKLRLRLTKEQSIYKSSGFEITLQMKTTSQQPGHDRLRSYPVVVKVEAKLDILGYPSNDQIKFGGKVIGESAVKKTEDVGQIHTHTYEVTNLGSAPAENVFIHIKWPQNLLNGKWLFYLIEANVRDDGGMCNLPKEVNPLGLEYVPGTRRKREAETVDDDPGVEPVTKSVKVPESSYEELKCGVSASCIEFNCSLGLLHSKEKRFIDLRAVLWNGTFLEEYKGVSVIQVQSSAYVSIPQENIEFSEQSKLNDTVSTSVLSEVIIPPQPGIKWWIIAAASAAGLLLLVVVVILLWKCGFFKRKKFGDYQKARRHKQASKKADERETLY